MTSPWPAVRVNDPEAVRRTGPAGRHGKSRAPACRHRKSRPEDRARLAMGSRPRSALRGRTLLRSSLSCVRPIPGAGHGEATNRP